MMPLLQLQTLRQSVPVVCSWQSSVRGYNKQHLVPSAPESTLFFFAFAFFFTASPKRKNADNGYLIFKQRWLQ